MDNHEEDKALGATSTMEEITKQLKLMLFNLEGPETKVETTIETVNQLQTMVNKLEKAVEKVQDDAKQLKENVVTMDKGVSLLNCKVEELQRNEKKHLERIKILEDQIMYQELYNRCENLCFLGPRRYKGSDISTPRERALKMWAELSFKESIG